MIVLYFSRLMLCIQPATSRTDLRAVVCPRRRITAGARTPPHQPRLLILHVEDVICYYSSAAPGRNGRLPLFPLPNTAVGVARRRRRSSGARPPLSGAWWAHVADHEPPARRAGGGGGAGWSGMGNSGSSSEID